MTVLDTPLLTTRPSRAFGPPRIRLSPVSEPTAPSLADPGRLLELSAAGDLDAFARFYDLMAPRVHGLALRVLRDPGYAEETVQEVFLQVWKQASGYSPKLGSVHSWVLTIAHRRAVDRVRSESSAARRDEADAAAGITHSGDIADHQQIRAERLKRGVGAGKLRRHGVRASARLVTGGAEGAHPHIDAPSQCRDEFGHVHTGPAVDLRRVLPGDHVHPHGQNASTPTRSGSMVEPWSCLRRCSGSSSPVARASDSCR